MTKYSVLLKAQPSTSFFATRAANSLDIDVEKKSVHAFSVEADLESSFSVGLIVGASGSGKTTLARSVWGDAALESTFDPSLALIDQFPDSYDYDARAAAMGGMGLTSVPCWIKPAGTLSNGQQSRGRAALTLARASGPVTVIDEWTSVVDRTVAKVMSHCVQKFARRAGRSIVLVSCHYDVLEWLDPDWIVDCNSAQFTDRRLLQPPERQRKQRLEFEVSEVPASTWQRFSKYHYLDGRALGGKVLHFGLFHEGQQVGYNCLANYVPWSDKSKPMIMHVSRTVIHPDFAGMGLGIQLDTAVAHEGKRRGFKIMAKFSSEPFFKMMARHKAWRQVETRRQIGQMRAGVSSGRGARARAGRSTGFRENVKTYTFEYIGQ
jgi:ABC-type thiamine transport system ATPase subunit